MTKYDVQSPNFHKGTEYMSPPMQPVRDILLEDKNVTVDVNKNPHPQVCNLTMNALSNS